MDTFDYPKPKKKYLGLIIPCAIVFALLVAACVYFFIGYDNYNKSLQSIDVEKNEVDIENDEVWSKDIALAGKSIYELNEEESSKDFYKAPNGLTIKSIASGWERNSLKTIYNELLKNTHGDELDYLREITLRPQDSSNGYFAGEYHEESVSVSAALAFSPLIDSAYLNFATVDYGVINLYRMKYYTDVKEFAHTLSHEYGHHYTYHHFFADDDKSKKSSDYYKIRGLSENPKATEFADYKKYVEMHAWDLSEIAADDYVQLLGSPTCKDIGEYMDIKEALYSPSMEYVGEVLTSHYNVFAQENPEIPYAEQIKELEDYYHSFINEDYAEQYTQYPLIVIDANEIIESGKTSYELTWNELKTDSEVIYTVIAYDVNGSLYRPIKTVSGGEKLSAIIGTPVRDKGGRIYYWLDNMLDEDKIFRVTAFIVSEGIIVGSEPYFFDA